MGVPCARARRLCGRDGLASRPHDLARPDSDLGAEATGRFIGFSNYLARDEEGWSGLLFDQDWWRAVYNTVAFTGVSVLLETMIGLGLALIIDREFPGLGLLRAATDPVGGPHDRRGPAVELVAQRPIRDRQPPALFGRRHCGADRLDGQSRHRLLGRGVRRRLEDDAVHCFPQHSYGGAPPLAAKPKQSDTSETTQVARFEGALFDVVVFVSGNRTISAVTRSAAPIKAVSKCT